MDSISHKLHPQLLSKYCQVYYYCKTLLPKKLFLLSVRFNHFGLMNRPGLRQLKPLIKTITKRLLYKDIEVKKFSHRAEPTWNRTGITNSGSRRSYPLRHSNWLGIFNALLCFMFISKSADWEWKKLGM